MGQVVWSSGFPLQTPDFGENKGFDRDGYQAGLSDGQGVEREICKDGGRHRFETTPGLSNHG